MFFLHQEDFRGVGGGSQGRVNYSHEIGCIFIGYWWKIGFIPGRIFAGKGLFSKTGGFIAPA
jgi:hypothetical protein